MAGHLGVQIWMTESTLWGIEVALGKRKLLERSEEEGVWGRSGPCGETLYGFFAIMGTFLEGLLTLLGSCGGSKT